MVLPDDILQEFELKNNSNEKITFIIPFRGANRIPHLLRCIGNVLRRYEGSEIIVVEEDERSVINRPLPGAKYVFVYSRRSFNKSLCFNLGFLIAANNIICGLDCDMIIPSTLLDLNLKYVNDKVVFPGLNIYYVKNDLDIINLNQDTWNEKTWKNSRVEWQFHGGIFLCTKKMFSSIGGFDQRFEGHGGEDTSFYLRATETRVGMCSQNINMLHMDHTYDDDKGITTTLNTNLMATLSKIHPVERIRQTKLYNIFNEDTASQSNI